MQEEKKGEIKHMQEEKRGEIKQLQPGYRFYPTEEELVSFYLRKKFEAKRDQPDIDLVIPVIDIYEFEPWLLPKLSGELCNGDTEQWFFFVPRQEREARGGRPNRTTASGYWKATGSPNYVYSSDNRVIGVKKSMVFYRGKAPTGKKTTWKMNEYRAIEEEMPCSSTQPIPKLRHEVSLCRVYIISGSFRAFDRRPEWTETRGEMSQDHLAARSTVLPSQMVELVARRSSSPKSSSSAKQASDFDHMDINEEDRTKWLEEFVERKI